MKTTARVTLVALMLFYAPLAQAVTIDMVSVGNPGNAPDTRYDATGFGSVANAYRIGKYEVTAGQYTEFLNAVADADPNGLYNAAMADLSETGHGFGPNIRRTGSSPNFSYSVAADWANRPVNWVSFWDAARFANWLHNGQPTGAQGPGTTEDGAYHDVGDQTLFGRNAGAKFFIPSEDEWYKAAYHDQTAGLAASYFDYPMGTNSEPGNDITETTNPGNNANYRLYEGNFAIGRPYWRTVAGEFEFSDSPYGTFDQGGNLWEWNETALGSSAQGTRGGAWGYLLYSINLHASLRDSRDPSEEEPDCGFRVASIPEPSSLLLAALAAAGLLWRRRGLLFASILAAAAGISCADRTAADTFGSGANQFDIGFVTIGDPGNTADTTGSPNPAGSVPYTYRMGKYEVSEDMIDKAKAEGGLAIAHSNFPGVDKPASSISWYEAGKFVNWLNTSTGHTPAYKFEDSGNFQSWDSGDAGYSADNPFRNSLAYYFLPNTDEWYKAAYYDPVADVYYDYPTGSDTVPDGIDFDGDTTFDAVFFDEDYNDFPIEYPNDITDVGVLSPYGTAGQGGNVWEWEESAYDLVNDNPSEPRGLRGGHWIDASSVLQASFRGPSNPSYRDSDRGFRVASGIPEPSTLLMGALAAAGLLVWRRR